MLKWFLPSGTNSQKALTTALKKPKNLKKSYISSSTNKAFLPLNSYLIAKKTRQKDVLIILFCIFAGRNS